MWVGADLFALNSVTLRFIGRMRSRSMMCSTPLLLMRSGTTTSAMVAALPAVPAAVGQDRLRGVGGQGVACRAEEDDDGGGARLRRHRPVDGHVDQADGVQQAHERGADAVCQGAVIGQLVLRRRKAALRHQGQTQSRSDTFDADDQLAGGAQCAVGVSLTMFMEAVRFSMCMR